jgi:hypothetical protein
MPEIATMRPGDMVRSFVAEQGLLYPDGNGMVRLPILVRGELRCPEAISRERALSALGTDEYIDTGTVQIMRRPLLDPAAGSQLFVLPTISNPKELIVDPSDHFATGLGRLRANEIAEYLERVGALLGAGTVLSDAVREVSHALDDTPIAYVDAALDELTSAFAPAHTLGAIDRELSFGSVPGRSFLDDWVGLDPAPAGLTARLSGIVHGGGPLPPRAARVHAASTRQLHITAGNSPVIPIISAIRGLSVRGAVTLKMPSGALVAGAALALALRGAGPTHPLTRFSSVAYWRGGDERIEGTLLAPEAFDRIVVWGAPDAVDSVSARCGRTKTLLFNPRYGVSLIGAGALGPDRFHDTVRRAVTDALVWNQKACIASLVLYVECDAEGAHRFAEAVAAELAHWEDRFPSSLSGEANAAVRRARRGGMRHGAWYSNGDP